MAIATAQKEDLLREAYRKDTHAQTAKYLHKLDFAVLKYASVNSQGIAPSWAWADVRYDISIGGSAAAHPDIVDFCDSLEKLEYLYLVERQPIMTRGEDGKQKESSVSLFIITERGKAVLETMEKNHSAVREFYGKFFERAYRCNDA
ncbi:MAG: hypothetical protein M1286_02405 [Candidatus Marsarchaeota archaeon]|nr:hypothetical protein [Candidatus Marsarchaeota archaeon]